MCSLWRISLYISIWVTLIFASSPARADTSTEAEECEKTIQICTLKKEDVILEKPKQGPKGDMGDPGPMGLPGPPGEDGVCRGYDKVGRRLRGTFHKNGDKLGQVLCKAAKIPVPKGEYIIGPEDIHVECIPRVNLTTLTCIKPVAHYKTEDHIIKHNEGSFWLSERGVNIEHVYNLTMSQMAWLQKKAASAFQTIRYHCLNSNPFPRDSLNKSLILLGWNDVPIDVLPTLKNPFTYSFEAETDHCPYAKKDEWSSTDIIISSDMPHRLPIIDFFVRDADGTGRQSLAIEHIELCFD